MPMHRRPNVEIRCPMSDSLHLYPILRIQNQFPINHAAATAASVPSMPFTYTIAPEHNIIHTNAEGRISLGDLDEHMRTVAHDPLFRPGMNTIADLRQARIFMSLQDAPDLVRLFIHQAKIRKKGCWAVLIDRHPEVHLIRFFISFMEHLPFKMRVFGNAEDARRWLQGSESGRN